MEITKTLYVTNRDEWRAWLAENHRTEKEIWLIYYKKHTRKPTIPYDDAVEEALCFGWIDGLEKRVDEERYAQRFTPRKARSNWSESNRRRVKKLIEQGKMTEAGLATINKEILDTEEACVAEQKKKATALPQYLKKALMTNKAAWENFKRLAPSHQRNYVRWITAAKKEETRQRRMQEAIQLLARNEKLGMK
ncbi:MAG: YdeI/OmpD-associated family protein [Pyrinomonadaceae bacterium]